MCGVIINLPNGKRRKCCRPTAKRGICMVQDTRKAVLQNLKDAGCPERIIRQFMELLQAGKVREALDLLGEHRSALLRRVHSGEKRIDCLDYLIYQIEQHNIAL